MDTNNIIEIIDISKKYTIGEHREKYVALRDIITETIKHPIIFFKKKILKMSGLNPDQEFWALKNINLTVKKGEAIGIIGPNGAGKSTLLKILSQITPPTTGEIRLKGRVVSLLEVGTGFHPELTGSENIYLNGAILGMNRKEIAQKFDDIVDFAGVRQFIDTPVKRYSSGMYVRLAFSIAAHTEPDVLIVDEVLAVGDSEFQKKCLGKMEEVTNTSGRTILFVSHNMAAIEKLCKKVVLLNKGEIIAVGPAKEVITKYLSDEYKNKDELSKIFPLTEKDLIIHDFGVFQDGAKSTYLNNDNPFQVKVSFETLKDLTQFRLGVYVKTSIGDTLLRTFTPDWNPEAETIKKGRYEAVLNFPEKLLMGGSYFLVLHASCFGIVDYLARHNINKIVEISKPLEFNQAHPSEAIAGNIIMKNEWNVQPR